MTPPPSDWRIVVPVKERDVAKSRLHPPDGVDRSSLAHAFALDTLSAVFAAVAPEQVVVVTSDAGVSAFARGQGARLETDPGEGLNAALRQGMRRVAAEPWAGPTGLLLGDLPALRPDELRSALSACALHDRAVVPDASGEGTVLLTARHPDGLEPRFGPGSARAHGRFATTLDLPLPGLRGDVDDDAGLTAALTLGVGPRTRDALARRLA